MTTDQKSEKSRLAPVCPCCDTTGNAKLIRSRLGLYCCGGCGKQFTVTVGTASEGSHLPLRLWYLAMYLMLSMACTKGTPRGVKPSSRRPP